MRLRTVTCKWSFDGEAVEGEAEVYTGLDWPEVAGRIADVVLDEHIDMRCHPDEWPGEFYLHMDDDTIIRCEITTEYEAVHTASVAS